MTPAQRAELVRRYFETVHRNPAETFDLYASEAVLHYSGRHRLSGDHRGPAGVMELFERSRQAFGGSQRLVVHEVLAGEDHAVALLTASATLAGREVTWNRVVVFHTAAGRITEQWIVDGDQQLVDDLIGT